MRSVELTYIEGRTFIFNIQVEPAMRAELDIVERVNAMTEQELNAVLTDYTLEDKKVKVAAYLIDEMYQQEEAARRRAEGVAPSCGVMVTEYLARVRAYREQEEAARSHRDW